MRESPACGACLIQCICLRLRYGTLHEVIDNVNTTFNAFFLSQLLKAIGVISKNDAKKANGQTSNYQDAATAPLDRSYDIEAALQDDDESGDEVDGDIFPGASLSDLSDDIFSSVDKVLLNLLS